MFYMVIATLPEITFVLFINNLGFLANGNSIKEVTISLEITGKTVLRWGLSNIVTYNIIKTETILFFKACY